MTPRCVILLSRGTGLRVVVPKTPAGAEGTATTCCIRHSLPLRVPLVQINPCALSCKPAWATWQGGGGSAVLGSRHNGKPDALQRLAVTDACPASRLRSAWCHKIFMYHVCGSS